MKVVAETFKGIEFVRISNLPEGQREFITISIPKDSIIKILKDNVVINDCIQYQHYNMLYNQYQGVTVANTNTHVTAEKTPSLYRLAFK